ncbi:hypothetical protein PTTG_25637 [Puccinia triticina 1-1 BBBD Race 1]|uniref:Uncharacterized protein n=1 Tax=Puccinia triticina (isolate 1-1 / race 1 (BBBD)) TaxID=630390 RepID=A0A180H0U1_PUCT1|nr:hypothetical protein PTTG_25637 [Puccinia triticina 1-1 BBBD Race 1]
MSSTPSPGFLSAKLTLDMSFNRTPSLAHHADIDPLSQPPPDAPPPPAPTFADPTTEPSGLESVLDGWRFPLRTDFARGIIWGPFRHTRGNSYHDGPDPALDRSRSYHEHSMAPARAQPAGRRHQRIFPILRPQSSSSLASSASASCHSSSDSSSGSASSGSASSAAAAPTTPPPTRPASPTVYLQTQARLLHQAAKALQARSKPTRPPQLFTLNIAPLGPHRRIRLCPSSQLKYGGHL